MTLQRRQKRARSSEVALTAEQIAEVERRLSDDGPYASEEETRAVFDRLRGKGAPI